MKNLIGAFLVLIVGLVFCLFITAVEFLNEVRNIALREQVSTLKILLDAISILNSLCKSSLGFGMV